MFFEVIFILTLCLMAYLSLRFYVLPKRRYDFYKRYIQEKGYKVYSIPFKLFGAPYFERYYEYFQSKGDSLYLQKNEFHKYDVILSNVLDTVCLTWQNLQLIKQFYLPQNVNILTKHPSLSEGIKLSLGHGIMFSQKDIWKRKRKIISKAFNYDLLNQNIRTIAQITDQTIEQMEMDNYFNSGQQSVFQFQPKDIGFRIFSRVMLRCFFQCEFVDNKINKIPMHQFLQSLFQQVNNLSGNLLVVLMGKWAYKLGLTLQHRNLKQKVSILQREILLLIQQKVRDFKSKQKNKNEFFEQLQTSELKQQQKSCNLIYKLLESKQKGQQSYDQNQLLQEFCTFLIVGTDTTANLLRTTLYYLSKNPNVEEKLRKEINQHIQSDEDLQKIQKLKKLTYLECIQHEVIRMACPSATSFIRIAEKDINIGHIKVLKNTGVFTESTGNHYNPAYFKNPQTFNPERWLHEKSSIPPFAFTGFFGGPRTCIGKHLSYLQSKIVLIKLLRRYHKFEISAGGQRMQVKFLYGPQRFMMKFQSEKNNVFLNDQIQKQTILNYKNDQQSQNQHLVIS